MSNEANQNTRLVPAICTQCGGQLEVDPTQEAAVCKYCGTPFIVEKAIQNYNIQHATIEHVDTVNIDMKGTADSFFSFVGTQMSESRALRREERKERRAEERETSLPTIETEAVFSPVPNVSFQYESGISFPGVNID